MILYIHRKGNLPHICIYRLMRKTCYFIAKYYNDLITQL